MHGSKVSAFVRGRAGATSASTCLFTSNDFADEVIE